jgi:small subunit ribosomal protein S9
MADESNDERSEQSDTDAEASSSESPAAATPESAEPAAEASESAESTTEASQPAATQEPAAADSEPAEAAAAESSAEPPAAEETAEASAAETAAAETPAAETPAAEAPASGTPAAETPAAETPAAESSAAETPASESPAAEAPAAGEAAEQPAAQEEAGEDEEEPAAPRVKPEVPGMHLEVDIVPEGADPFGREESNDPYATDPYASEDDQSEQAADDDQAAETPQPIATAAIDLAAGARYAATGKRKTAIARVILKPGGGSYQINGRELEAYVPRTTLQRNIRQPLETVGFHERMDVIARVQGGGISSQAGALRHGIARALIEADPNLRGELKRRGFLTRDARVKERKKAGLKKARKRPQFSKR